MTARPLAGPGEAAEPWPPPDWFRAPDRSQDPVSPDWMAPGTQDRVAQFRTGQPGTAHPLAARFPAGEFPAEEPRLALARTEVRQALGRVAWPWWVLWPWAVAWVAFQAGMAGQSWHFFAQGGRAPVR